MKKIEMGKKYKVIDTRTGRLDANGGLKFIDGKRDGVPVVWESDEGNLHFFNAYGQSGLFRQLVEIPHYADIPIDTPGWARFNRGNWEAVLFAGTRSDGRPIAWKRCDFTYDEFTTTKPEGA